MFHYKTIFQIIFIIFLFKACQTESGRYKTFEEIQQMKFVLLNEDTLVFSELYKNDANVFIFLSPECPLSIKYTYAINKITKEFESESIVFYGVFPGRIYSLAEIKNYVEKYNMHFNMLLDEDYNLTSYLNARVTPEVVILDNSGKTLYQGAIDNWIVTLGRMRQNITEFYLKDALFAIKNNNIIQLRNTEAIGCLIE